MKRTLEDLYTSTQRRLLLLDYDGTLRDFEPRPELATPTSSIKLLLGYLSADPRNTLVVVSGRDHLTLDGWFGELPVYLVAEHGMACRAPGSDWEFAQNLPTAWQKDVRHLMDQSLASAPGSLVEAKSNSLAWHYRAVEPKTASKARAKLLDNLSPVSKAHNLRVLNGNKCVEVQPLGIDKGSSVRRWFDTEAYDFVLAMGDDITDEDLFRAMPASAFTVKVGEGETAASERVPNPAAARSLLTKLAHSQ